MVASNGYRVNAKLKALMFQSPSLRGSGRFPPAVGAYSQPARPVSIPFIAGQWSLRYTRHQRNRGFWFQSPSLRGSGRFPQRREAGDRMARVSIPFIAGQWSLRFDIRLSPDFLALFQSPSLRGSGRFKTQSSFLVLFLPVSIPFIAGQWSLPNSKMVVKKGN